MSGKDTKIAKAGVPELRRLITRKQVAEILNVTPRTIDNYCDRGLKFIQLPGAKRFDPADVERFIQDRKFQHSPDPTRKIT